MVLRPSRSTARKHLSANRVGYPVRSRRSESAGIRIIQVDEPALREGMPLRRQDRDDYLDWATECFRLATAGVSDGTQIHTHMCYAEFGDIIDAIIALDADVISIEAARSGMGILTQMSKSNHLADVGPGVWDIHSPTVPSADEMATLIEQALDALPVDQVWVNPDCGLKTRRWIRCCPPSPTWSPPPDQSESGSS